MLREKACREKLMDLASTGTGTRHLRIFTLAGDEDPMRLSEKRGPSRRSLFQTVAHRFGGFVRLAQHDDSLWGVSFLLGQARMAWVAADVRQKTKQKDLRSIVRPSVRFFVCSA